MRQTDFPYGEDRGCMRLTHIRKPLAAIIVTALMGFLACVRPNMYGQSTPLDETLPTVGLVTCIRSLIGMDAIMSLEIGFSVEAL